MKLSPSPIAGALLLVLLLLPWGPASLQASDPSTNPHALEYQLLTNPGMEVYDPLYGLFEGVSCQVATGWQRFSYDGPEPCHMDTRVFAGSHLGGGWVERIEGSTSQMIVSTEPYTAGLWQRVTGLTPGLGYGFHAAMLTIYQSSAPPVVDGTMIKQVGIDPTAGTDPQAQSVVWSEPDGRDEAWDINQRVSLHAQAPEATVFVRVASPLGAGPWPYMNLSFLDSAILARTTPVTASSPGQSEPTSFVVSWSHGEPAPGVARVKWYDIQWLDEAEGEWHDWLTEIKVRDGKVQETFTGERGHTYRFRARVWQKYDNGAHLYSPYRPGGDTRTVVGGPELVGRVVSNEGHGAAGVTVSISDTGYAAMSGAGGYYGIGLLPTTEAYSVMVQHPFWLSPAPVHGVTFGPTETVTIDWSLRPPDDAVANGEFESGLSGWETGSGPGGMPAVVADPVHTGHGALALSGGAGATTVTGITQTVALTRSWEPALSFWYRPQSTDPDDLFSVVLTTETETHVLTPSLVGNDWQHLWLYAASEDAYFTGTLTVHFQLRNDGDSTASTIYLDEVSLGRTAGGPFKAYLPLALKGD
jgi:hypothetical protein